MRLSSLSEGVRDNKWITEPYAGDAEFVYRGMSMEEWKNSVKTGTIWSNGDHNYDIHRNGTCYGSFSDAEHYGLENQVQDISDLTYDFKHMSPRESYVGVIIEIPRTAVVGHEEDRRVHHGEFMHFEPIPLSLVHRKWLLSPIVKNGAIQYQRSEF